MLPSVARRGGPQPVRAAALNLAWPPSMARTWVIWPTAAATLRIGLPPKTTHEEILSDLDIDALYALCKDKGANRVLEIVRGEQ